MNVVGIIAEYNPFHQGHALQLREARAKVCADYVVVVMSGNYVQRETPAMFDKYTRAEAALRGGADLVLELPVTSATASAEYFATGAVALLEKTGFVTDLSFGSECGSLPDLQRIAEILAYEPEEYRALLRSSLSEGNSFPRARSLALDGLDSSLHAELLESPNNLLGIEYLKTLIRMDSGIRPHTITRRGGDYHELTLRAESAASTGAIRAALLASGGHFTEEIRSQLPCPEPFLSYEGKTPLTEDAFSLLLLQRLRGMQDAPLGCFFDVSPDLSNRIWEKLDLFSSFPQFIDLLKTKNLTRTAVSRALLHILLDIRGWREPEAFRVLGFRKEAECLIGLLKKNSTLPLILAPSDTTLPADALYADHLYESVRSLLHGTPFQNEYRRKLLVIPSTKRKEGLP
ncbi:MAG: nucleotidyltransferase family protein [Lachnospiraceae bacterium]|nr:nucleotidyltransferase family protein [Lachnospiraceae bacterium]